MAKMSLGDWLAQQDTAQAPQGQGNMSPVIPAPVQQQDAPQSPYNTWGDKAASFMGGVNHGFYMGAPGLVQSKADPEGWKRTLDRNAEHPYTNAAGQIVGGTLNSVVSLPYKAMQGLGWAGRVGLSALQGGTQGGVTNFNEALSHGADTKDALYEGGKGAIGGALGGAVGQGAGEIMGDIAGRMIASRMTPSPKTAGPNSGPNRFASDTINDSMLSTGATPSRVEGDIAHLGPQGMMADHPTMVPAVQQLNKIGGEGHEMFANVATERVAGAPQRRAADFKNPPPSYQTDLNAKLQSAGSEIDRVANGFGPDDLLDGHALRMQLAEIANKSGASYGEGAMGSKVLKLAESIPDNAHPLTLHNTKKELDAILGYDRTKGPEPGPLLDTRRVIDTHLDNFSDPYNAANQHYRNLKLQEEAHALGLQRNLESADAVRLNNAAKELNFMPTAPDEVVTAYERGAADRMQSGPMERETVFKRTQDMARRPPKDENPAVDMATAGALNAAHGPGAMITAAGGVGATRMAGGLFKPGEKEGAALARFLQMTGDERAQVLREIAERGGTVRNKGKEYAHVLKGTLRGLGEAGGQMGMNAIDTPEWLR